ncbi:peptidoglycan recognition protein-like isoform X2 [Neodiprion pinetum]|uniref:peptidoglycan recognition protein-like isoform X2 n=1 Tax=Neodiprion pinetum TaxID=441929 RepID=UPI00371A285E
MDVVPFLHDDRFFLNIPTCSKLCVTCRCVAVTNVRTTDGSTQRRVILLTWQILAFILGLFLIAAVITILALLRRDSCCSSPSYDYPESLISSMDGDDLPSNLPLTQVNTTFSDSPTNISGLPINNLRFVTRNEWGAQPPTEPLGKLKHPVPYVIISHTATEFCDTQSTCAFRVCFAQVFHMESRNWSDIAYNFLIGGDAYAYIGRGWDHVGAHAYGYNSRSIGISFIGTYNTVAPSDHQMNALQQLIEIGVKSGKIAADYKLLGHRQVSKTPSPGDALYNIITTWPHWSPTP